jgi:hypothetical protein
VEKSSPPGGRNAPRKSPKRRRGRPRRGGRPEGSVKLTPDMEDSIVSMTRAGVYDYVAAEAVGVDARTFRDWMARGEGRHPTRRNTPQLKAFAKRIRQARAQGRAAKEIEVARDDPKYWLSHVARSRPDREGWTDPVEGPDPVSSPSELHPPPTEEEAAKVLNILITAGLFRPPECTAQSCPCPSHGGSDD